MKGTLTMAMRARQGETKRWGPLSLIAALLLTVALCGCGKSTSGTAQPDPASAGPLGAELARMERAFESAEPRRKFAVEDTLRIVKTGAYTDALPALQKLAAAPALTPEQQESLQQLIARVQTMAAGRR